MTLSDLEEVKLHSDHVIILAEQLQASQNVSQVARNQDVDENQYKSEDDVHFELSKSIHDEEWSVVKISVLEDSLTEADMFLSHAIGARRHLDFQDLLIGFDRSKVVSHGVR